MCPACEQKRRHAMIVSQDYSPSTGETLTVWDRDGWEFPPVEEQIAWIGSHSDSVRVYSRDRGD